MRKVFVSAVLCALTAAGGCASDADDPDAPVVEITYPMSSAILRRDTLDDLGQLVSRQIFQAEARSDVARVEFRIFNGPNLGVADGRPLELAVDLPDDGQFTLEAYAFGADDTELGTAVTQFWVQPAQLECLQFLELYGLDYAVGPEMMGVPDPVTVTAPIAGLHFRYLITNEVRTAMQMDCELAKSIAAAAPTLKGSGVEEIIDIGIHNYRCIGEGEPPDCPQGLSQHALARALDIHAVITGDGTEYNVETDWVIDSIQPTCAADTENEKDAFLHSLICALSAERVWNLILTPNYNEAHRDHFHVDLTAGADQIL